MADMISRVFVEKKPSFNVEAQNLLAEVTGFLGIQAKAVRLFNRYDLQFLKPENLSAVTATVLSEPMSNNCYFETLPPLPEGAKLIFTEPLPGQLDLRSDSCAQSIQMLIGGEAPVVRCARVYCFDGISDAELASIKAYLINPVETREVSPDKPATLLREYPAPGDIPVLNGFTDMKDAELPDKLNSFGLAMNENDLAMVREYFKGEKRNPTLTELRVIDTYWSDHCRQIGRAHV